MMGEEKGKEWGWGWETHCSYDRSSAFQSVYVGKMLIVSFQPHRQARTIA